MISVKENNILLRKISFSPKDLLDFLPGNQSPATHNVSVSESWIDTGPKNYSGVELIVRGNLGVRSEDKHVGRYALLKGGAIATVENPETRLSFRVNNKTPVIIEVFNPYTTPPTIRTFEIGRI